MTILGFWTTSATFLLLKVFSMSAHKEKNRYTKRLCPNYQYHWHTSSSSLWDSYSIPYPSHASLLLQPWQSFMDSNYHSSLLHSNHHFPKPPPSPKHPFLNLWTMTNNSIPPVTHEPLSSMKSQRPIPPKNQDHLQVSSPLLQEHGGLYMLLISQRWVVLLVEDRLIRFCMNCNHHHPIRIPIGPLSLMRNIRFQS